MHKLIEIRHFLISIGSIFLLRFVCCASHVTYQNNQSLGNISSINEQKCSEIRMRYFYANSWKHF
jgi:hypothetical protein